MTVRDIASTASSVLSSIADGVGTLLEKFVTPVEILFPDVPWGDLPIDVGDLTLMSLFLGTGVVTFLAFSLAKWVLDLVT